MNDIISERDIIKVGFKKDPEFKIVPEHYSGLVAFVDQKYYRSKEKYSSYPIDELYWDKIIFITNL